MFTSSVDRLSGAIDDQGLQVSGDVRTDIEIISDNGTGACVYNCSGNENLTLLVKNTGSQRLPAEADQIDVLIDGQLQPVSDKSVTVVGDSETWDRGRVIRLEISEPGLDSDGQPDHRAKVIVNGDEEVFEFRV